MINSQLGKTQFIVGIILCLKAALILLIVDADISTAVVVTILIPGIAAIAAYRRYQISHSRLAETRHNSQYAIQDARIRLNHLAKTKEHIILLGMTLESERPLLKPALRMSLQRRLPLLIWG